MGGFFVDHAILQGQTEKGEVQLAVLAVRPCWHSIYISSAPFTIVKTGWRGVRATAATALVARRCASAARNFLCFLTYFSV
jgi:hypothetical protein